MVPGGPAAAATGFRGVLDFGVTDRNSRSVLRTETREFPQAGMPADQFPRWGLVDMTRGRPPIPAGRPSERRKTMFLPLRFPSSRSSNDVVRPAEEKSVHFATGRALRLVGVVACLLAVSAGPVAGQGGSSLQPCLTCDGTCEEGRGGDCQVDALGERGGTSCRKNVVWVNHPLGEEGWFECFCAPTGDLCVLRQAFAPTDQERLGREATGVVASGGMLPADGLFFVGFRNGERVVRWKCDGSIAGRITQAGKLVQDPVLG